MAKAGPGKSRPIHLVEKGGLANAPLPRTDLDWAEANGFDGAAGKLLVLPGEAGHISGALFGLGGSGRLNLSLGGLAKLLPQGDWHIASNVEDASLSAIGIQLGGYRFDRYRASDNGKARIAALTGADGALVDRTVAGVFLARDLINTPANDMGPQQLEDAVRQLAKEHDADVGVTTGDALLKANFPLIHAVGRASPDAPRLIDLRWGRADATKVTLVGKGVCFDTGGLDIKPASNMLLMKKDMGGAANVLGLASMLMAAKLDVRLRVLIPAVENAISGSAFRPSDVIRSRKGISVEIGNTDAEGRLVLADALALADEEAPDLLIDMATLTGAARTALGPDLPPFFTDDEALAAELAAASVQTEDPLWRLPLWSAYKTRLSSRVADTNNVSADTFAGALIAALFLQRFVEKAASWAHFDIYGWNPTEKPWSPIGGEAQGIRALQKLMTDRYGRV